jgi:simple sugar transport system ATP-binding protein
MLEARTEAVEEADIVLALTGSAPSTGSTARIPDVPPTNAPPVLSLSGVSYVDPRGVTRLRDVTLEVRHGEILGVIGVEGSGERELLRLLAGRLEPTTGVASRPVAVGFIPDDRQQDALIPSLSLVENFALAGIGRRHGRLDWPAEVQRTEAAIAEFRVVSTGVSQRVAELSGGNQQRFVVAREQAIAPSALVAENPGRGLDIRAASQVNAQLVAAARAGAAVVLYSRNLDDVLAIATRVVACHAGQVRSIVAPEGDDRSPFARAMIGLP